MDLTQKSFGWNNARMVNISNINYRFFILT